MLEQRTDDSLNFVLYRYDPSIAAAIIFIILFGISTVWVSNCPNCNASSKAWIVDDTVGGASMRFMPPQCSA